MSDDSALILGCYFRFMSGTSEQCPPSLPLDPKPEDVFGPFMENWPTAPMDEERAREIGLGAVPRDLESQFFAFMSDARARDVSSTIVMRIAAYISMRARLLCDTWVVGPQIYFAHVMKMLSYLSAVSDDPDVVGLTAADRIAVLPDGVTPMHYAGQCTRFLEQEEHWARSMSLLNNYDAADFSKSASSVVRELRHGAGRTASEIYYALHCGYLYEKMFGVPLHNWRPRIGLTDLEIRDITERGKVILGCCESSSVGATQALPPLLPAIERVLAELPVAYAAASEQYDESIAHLLRSPDSAKIAEEQKTTIESVVTIFTHYVFEKALKKEIFGTLADLDAEVENEYFQHNLGRMRPPCLDLARAYWTLRKTARDVERIGGPMILSRVLREVERVLRTIFFCDPEYWADDPLERERNVRAVIALHVPEWNADEFWSSCPRTDQERVVSAMRMAAMMGIPNDKMSECPGCNRTYPWAALMIDPARKICPRCIRLGVQPPAKKWHQFWK